MVRGKDFDRVYGKDTMKKMDKYLKGTQKKLRELGNNYNEETGNFPITYKSCELQNKTNLHQKYSKKPIWANVRNKNIFILFLNKLISLNF
ncbi:MAG: hypothetical protein KIH08_06465 [Candidatus Freyarchaeota archaeon]|nr:hypothetical protein [Candidatus Jordarchaeia archaeon]MBS7269234.1 hypothetical protein [Candidatus Jordarchaeia archaeon]MBS7280103.1 hypothetical protein [Candidatus Jordarchaeia archaeon]